MESYVEAARERFGGIDCFFNNAGIEGLVTPLTEYPQDDFDRVLGVNVRGVWLGLKHVGAAMREQDRGGAIVNSSSVAGLGGVPGQVAYSASKHAVVGLTRTAALEFAGDEIRVNAVCPAPVETAMMRSIERQSDPDAPEEVKAAMARRNPMRRYGEPEEWRRWSPTCAATTPLRHGRDPPHRRRRAGALGAGATPPVAARRRAGGGRARCAPCASRPGRRRAS